MNILILIFIIGFGAFAVSTIFGFVVWDNIFSRAGYSDHGLRAFLLFIPVINFIIFFQFAFGEWPIERQKREEDFMKNSNGVNYKE